MSGTTTARSVPAPKRPARMPKLDAACADAVELARTAAGDAAPPDQLGEYQGCAADGDRVVTHYFECTHSGYVGWRWSVTVGRAARAKGVTVNEVVLVPGTEALVAPEWLPWHERVLPGDLGPGDLLPTTEDDPRLEPGYTATDGSDDQLIVDELGLGRPRVLSVYGRDEAADRWYSGTHGPADPIAQAAPAPCASCGFFVRLSGALGAVLGVCANGYSPRDGQVVAMTFGCGAHSEAVGTPHPPEVMEPVFDTVRYDDA